MRLERLQRLHEAGALTKDEFDREKASLLARSGFMLWVVAGALIVVIGAALAMLLSFPRTIGSSASPHTESVAARTVSVPSSAAAPTTTAGTTVRDRPMNEQMIAAFKVAFGRSPPATLKTNEDTRVFRPKRLIWIGDLAVLLSEGGNTSDCHSCAGALAIHYLAAAGERFDLKGAWPDLVMGAGWGSPPQWQISTKFTSYPAIIATGGFTAQGCTSGGMTITELRPERPVQSDLIRTTMSNDSGYGDPDQIEGHVSTIKKDQFFDIAYTGTRHFTERWIYKGDRFILESGQTKMPQC